MPSVQEQHAGDFQHEEDAAQLALNLEMEAAEEIVGEGNGEHNECESVAEEEEADEEQEGFGTQSDDKAYYEHASNLANDCQTEYDELVAAVLNKPDPAEGARDRLQKLAQEIWKKISGAEVGVDDLASILRETTPARREEFFEKWSTFTWDAKALYAATEVHKKPKGMSLRAFVHQTTEAFYTKLLSGTDARTPKDIQAATPLAAMAPKELAVACQRVSIGYGLPPDGQLVGQALQSQAAYYWHGADGTLKIPALKESESEWNVGNTRLPFIAEGDVSSGR